MKRIFICFGGSPQEARDAYKAWWDKQRDIELLDPPPALEQDGNGWKLTVTYRKSKSK
jgi:hypothetical protein